MITVVLHIYYNNNIKSFRIQFCVIIFVTSLYLLMVSTRENVVSLCKSDDPSFIVNYFIKLWQRY